jgi:predicted amidohydrolase YtcJ
MGPCLNNIWLRFILKSNKVRASLFPYPMTVPSPPLTGIMLGITRCEHGTSNPDEVLNPKEKMSLADMIEGFTINGAYANFVEDITGSIEVGKMADMVILDKNLFDIPATEIMNVKVLLTLFEGKEVYRDATLFNNMEYLE